MCTVRKRVTKATKEMALFWNFELFLGFFVDYSGPQRRIKLHKLKLALNLFLIFAAEIDVVRLRGAEFYKAIL